MKTKIVLGAVAVLAAACTRSDDPEPVTLAEATFAGSSACVDCHAAQFDAWQGSHHELAMQHANASTVLGDFSTVDVDYYGEQTRFEKRDGGFFVTTANAAGAAETFEVKWVFGLAPLQQYLVEFPGGRLQALPYAWDTRDAAEGGQRWFHLYPDEYIEPGDILHWTGRQMNWNFMCAECHSTNLRPGYDAASDTFDTTYSEVSVGCEACHGPGSTHVTQARQGGFDSHRYGLTVDLDDHGRATWIMNQATGIAERSEPAMRPPQQPESCGRCHARRSVLTEDYVYGQPLTATHMPSLLEPNLYFADGQIQDEVYVYGSFLQSRMYRAGVTCSDCHEPHSLALRTGPDPNAVCAQCHLPSKFAAEAHTGHAPQVAGCVDCHMPDRTYMVVDDRRDHSFRIPRPDLTGPTGSPNACMDCHAQAFPEWAAAALQSLHGAPARPEYATAIHAGRNGDGNDLLLAALDNSSTPGIARATALELLGPELGEDEARELQAAIVDPDPLVRMAAARTLRFTPPDFRVQAGTGLLADDQLAVRIEAVMAFADVRENLNQRSRQAFDGAAAEMIASHEAQLNRPESWVSLGDFAVARGDLEAGIEQYEHALVMQPLLVRTRVNMADALRRYGDDARGRVVLEEGIARVPEAGALHHSLGLLYVRQGEPAAALSALRRAVEIEPANARYAYVLEVAESELGGRQPDDARGDQ